MVAGNKICWLLSKAMGEKMYHLSTKVSWRHTIMWTVKNAVENSRIIKAWDLLSPIDWLSFVSSVMSSYSEKFWKKMIENLWNRIAYDAKQLLDPIATKIANWEAVDLSKYKRAAQSLWRNNKAIKELFLDKWTSSDEEIRDAAVYYAAATIDWYMKSFWDMNKTISQYQWMVESWLDPYPYYFSQSSKDIYIWMVSNMQNMLESITDLNNFIKHSAQQDSLRLLENFNHKPLEWISDLSEWNIKKSMKKFAEIYSTNPKNVWLSESQYKKLIRQMNGNYDPISLMAGQKTSKIMKAIVKTSADARRFSTWVLNFPMAIALWGWAWTWYTMNAVWARSSWLYNLWKLEWIRDIIWYKTENVFWMSTKADINDIISSWVWSWDLSYLNRISKWINWFSKTQLEELWVRRDIAAMVWESAWEALKWLHNIPDSVFKIVAQNTAIWQALRQMQYLDEKAFLSHYKASTNKEALAQELRRLTDEYMQIGVWFFGPSTWNISTFNDMPIIKHLMYLASWWLNMAQNFFNLIWGRPIWLLIDWITWAMWWVEGAFKKAVWLIWDHYTKDPAVNQLFKTMYYTAFIWHKIQMLMDDEDDKSTVTQRVTKSFGTYWRWMNNYLQWIESNRVWRLWLSMVNMYNSPFMEWHKVTWMIAWMFKSFSRDYLSVLKWSSMLVNSLAAVADPTFDEWWFSMQMFKEFYNERMKQAQWMNRYFINETMASLDSKNVPLSQFDNWNMILWRRLSSVSQTEEAIRNVSDAKKLEENAWNWMFQQIMYNSSMAKYFQALGERYDPKATEKWVVSIFDKLSELKVISDEWLLPLEIPWDDKRTKQWIVKINDTIKHLWVYWWSKDKTLSDIFIEKWIRNPDNFEETYTYKTLNTIADLMSRSEMTDKQLFQLEKLRDSNIKWKSDALAWELMLRYVMKDNWSDGSIVLNKLAYGYRKKLEQQYSWKKYVGNGDLTEAQQDEINKQVATRFWKYIQMVDLNAYTSLMKSYVEKNPEFNDLKVFYDNWSMKGDVANWYKTVLFTMANISNWWTAETMTQVKNIIQSLHSIKDDWFKMAITAQAYDMLEQSHGVDPDSRLQIEARMFKEISPLIQKAIDRDEYMDKHREIINKMLEMQHGTAAQVQQMKDNEYNKQVGVWF